MFYTLRSVMKRQHSRQDPCSGAHRWCSLCVCLHRLWFTELICLLGCCWCVMCHCHHHRANIETHPSVTAWFRDEPSQTITSFSFTHTHTPADRRIPKHGERLCVDLFVIEIKDKIAREIFK